MKKKIIFMVINMNVGGTEKALLNMIAEMPKDQYDVTILMLEKYGGFLGSIPREVQVKYLEGYQNIKDTLNNSPYIVFMDLLKKGKIIKAFNVIFFHLICKLMKDRSLFFKYVLRDYPVIDNEYDSVVAYAGPMDFISYFVVKKIVAKKKIQWIHFDVTKVSFNKVFSANIYKEFDQIFTVSNEAKNKLISIIPSIKKKTDVFPNVISSNLIQKQAKDGKGFSDNFTGLRILTVGRLANEKGQDLAIRVLSRLIGEGFKVKWYCLGDGSSRKQYEELIEHYSLKDTFILLGEKRNPYVYMDECDIYVQPSRHEGYCITLAEARYLNKAIVTTNFTGAKEQIRHEETGLIVDVDEDDIYEAVKKLVINQNLCEYFSRNLAIENYDQGIKKKKRLLKSETSNCL